MAGLNVITIQDSIAAHVRAEFPGYTVYDDDIIDDDFVVKLGNKIKPYIVLQWGGLRNSPTNGSFGGVRYDEYYSTVDVAVVAPVARQSREAINIIGDRLIGWKPLHSTPLSLEDGMEILGIPGPDGKPVVYFASIRLKYNVNAEDVASHIVP